MKRVIIAPILLILILTICVSTVVITDSKVEPLVNDLYKLIDYGKADDIQNATQLAHTIESQWKELENTFSFYLHHNTYESTAQTISAIIGYAECGEMPELVAESYSAIGMLNHINDSLKPTLGNIF